MFVEKPFFEDPRILKERKKKNFLKSQKENEVKLEKISLNRKNIYDIVDKPAKKTTNATTEKNKIDGEEKK